MLQLLTTRRKQMISERDQLLYELDLKYMDYINTLLQQKHMITNNVQNQYDEQINKIDNLFLSHNANSKGTLNQSDTSSRKISSKQILKAIPSEIQYVDIPSISAVNDAGNEQIDNVSKNVTLRKQQWDNTKLNTTFTREDIKQLLINRGMDKTVIKGKKLDMINCLTEKYDVHIKKLSTLTNKAIIIELRLHGLSDELAAKDILIERLNHKNKQIRETPKNTKKDVINNLFACAHCKHSCKTYNDLKSHISDSHFDRRKMSLAESNQTNGCYHCDLCSTLFNRKTSYCQRYVLSNHKLMIHAISDTAPLHYEWKDTMLKDANNTSLKRSDIIQLLITRGEIPHEVKNGKKKAELATLLMTKYSTTPPEQLSILTTKELIIEIKLRGLDDTHASKDVLIQRLYEQKDKKIAKKNKKRQRQRLVTICVECLKKDDQESIIKCSKCYSGYHIDCIPNASFVVEKDYICLNCVAMDEEQTNSTSTNTRSNRLKNKRNESKSTNLKKEKQSKTIPMKRAKKKVSGHKRKERSVLSPTMDDEYPNKKKIRIKMNVWDDDKQEL